MNIKTFVQAVNDSLNVARVPLQRLAGVLIYATAVQRPGISKLKISSEIIAENETYGINIGQMPDGTDNVVNKFVYNVAEKVIDNLKDEALVECVIPKGSVIVTAKGANAGGPVVAVGTNINDAKGYGIVR